MTQIVETGYTYKLRAGAPLPIGNANFVTHTFKAEETRVDTFLYTNSLPHSSSFRGQGGDYISGNFSRLLDEGGESFQGSITYTPIIISETGLGV